MVWADLHMHSAASDGQLSPTDLVRKAQAAGIELLALTDHDTLSGTEEAIRAGRTYGIQVLRGIELGASEHRYMHLACLMSGLHCLRFVTRYNAVVTNENIVSLLFFMKRASIFR